MNLRFWQDRFIRAGRPTSQGWALLVGGIVLYLALKHLTSGRRHAEVPHDLPATMPAAPTRKGQSKPTAFPDVPLPAKPPQPLLPPESRSLPPGRIYKEPSFGNVNAGGKVFSEDFLPKGTMLYAVLTSDIVSNNQVSPATATVIHPVIFAHKLRIPVGTHLTGRIAPGNLRGRVFVTWDTLIFQEEGRQGWELPLKGVGMTYEAHPHSGRWVINGAGLKGYVFDDSTAQAFKLAALRGLQDFTKTLQTVVTAQTSTVTAAGAAVTTTTTPEATLQNSGLAAAGAFIDVIASRYAAQLQQQGSYVLVPTSRMCAIFLDEPIDIAQAAPGRSHFPTTR